MTNSFATQTDAELRDVLSREIDVFPQLTPADQHRIVSLARGLMERGMDLPFVLAGVRSSAEVLADLEGACEDPVMSRPEVRRFVEENAPLANRTTGHIFRGNDVKRAERERLQQKTVTAIREARRSHGRHEVKKTRNMLMKIDQRELRRRLGREGDDLCCEINTILRAMAPMF
jgi:hypothetical protein